MSKVNKNVNMAQRLSTGHDLAPAVISQKLAVGKFLTELAAKCGAGALAMVIESEVGPTMGTFDFWRSVPAQVKERFLAHLEWQMDMCARFRERLGPPRYAS